MDYKVCRHLDQDFLGDTNIHKYALLWSSKFYQLINHIMRDVPLEKIITKYPCATYYVREYIKYFYQKGLTRDQLLQKYTHLYRGVTRDFDITHDYDEKALMSTTFDKRVAKRFAGEDGVVSIFPIESLPENVPYLLIDDQICDYLLESEILFLPGHIRVRLMRNNLLMFYMMNQEMVSAYLNARVTQTDLHQGGGGVPEIESLGGYWVVFHREIIGRAPEILCKKHIPHNKKTIQRFFYYNVRRISDSYDQIMNLMPEVQDIKKLINDPIKSKIISPKDESLLYQKLFSYYTNIAIYDPYKNMVSTLYYGAPSDLYEEITDQTRNQEIIKAILDNCRFLSQK